MDNLDLPGKERTGGYKRHVLIKLEEEIMKLHLKYPLGIVIDKEIHQQYHSIYKDDVTPESFNQYLKDYHNQNFVIVLSKFNKEW